MSDTGKPQGKNAAKSGRKSTDYEFRTVWRVAGTTAEVAEVLGDAAALPRWWPSVYLGVETLTSGNPGGVGNSFALYTTGWLPYTLRWTLTHSEPITEQGWSAAAHGDLTGTARWTLEQDGPEVVVTCDWKVSASKPLIRRLSWLFRPIFSANHHWAMARGGESLALELRRRRHATEPWTIPAPPGPTFTRLTGLMERLSK
ncbi:SRPBCC family protein [Arthrobacter sp. M4]|uniref:SRPBCC family protein n=1 Tax=Arthrobacter sp. M4 TaxID=218160 RepID=UPI001CDB8D67|nr:SRPBCC family protein [Arthrobacter sp. M4]MCA4134415.1 polyketide cyclase [Arthrobacter sp. M4]